MERGAYVRPSDPLKRHNELIGRPHDIPQECVKRELNVRRFLFFKFIQEIVRNFDYFVLSNQWKTSLIEEGIFWPLLLRQFYSSKGRLVKNRSASLTPSILVRDHRGLWWSKKTSSSQNDPPCVTNKFPSDGSFHRRPVVSLVCLYVLDLCPDGNTNNRIVLMTITEET